MLAMDRNVFASEGRECIGEAVVGIGIGIVSDRFRISIPLLPVSSARSCAADTEGLSFRGVIEPPFSAVISSPLVDGPADAYWDPFDLWSVDVVP